MKKLGELAEKLTVLQTCWLMGSLGYLLTIVVMTVVMGSNSLDFAGMMALLCIVPFLVAVALVYRLKGERLKRTASMKKAIFSSLCNSVLVALLVPTLYTLFAVLINFVFPSASVPRDLSGMLAMTLITTYVGFLYSIPAVLVFGTLGGWMIHRKSVGQTV